MTTDTATEKGGSSTLFRSEAIRYRGSRLGRVALGQALTSWAFTALLVAALATLGAFLTLGRYARKETVPGYVIPGAGAVEVYASRSGTIDSVRVALGDRVAAGDPLFSVRDSAELTGGGAVSSALSARLDGQLAHLAAQRASVQRLFEHRIARLDLTLTTTRQALHRATTRLGLARQRLGLTEDALRARQTLAEARVLSLDQLREGRAELLAVQLEVEQAAASREELEARLPALRLERNETAAERDRRVAELDAGLEGLRAQGVESRARQALVTVAPIAGVVAFSQVGPGQPANLQSPAMTLVPEDGDLEIRLLIPSRAKAFIAPGQTVRIKYDAFPYQHFGTQAGVVVGVSSAAVAGRHLIGPLATGDPAYLARVRLERDHVAAYGQKYPVQPGMTLAADVVLAERRLIEWLLEPLLRMRG